MRLNKSNKFDRFNNLHSTENSQQQYKNLQTPSSVQNLLAWPQQIAQIQSRQQEVHSIDLNSSLSFDPDLENDDVNNSSINPEERGAVENSINFQTLDGKQDSTFSMDLIEEVRKYPCIWNISLKSNRDKPKKMEAWRRISTSLKVAGQMAIQYYLYH